MVAHGAQRPQTHRKALMRIPLAPIARDTSVLAFPDLQFTIQLGDIRLGVGTPMAEILVVNCDG